MVQDVSFWLPDTGFTENNLCEVVRSQAGDLVEAVVLTDAFTNPKTQRQSNCFRVTYRSMDRSLTDEEINSLQARTDACRWPAWACWRRRLTHDKCGAAHMHSLFEVLSG